MAIQMVVPIIIALRGDGTALTFKFDITKLPGPSSTTEFASPLNFGGVNPTAVQFDPTRSSIQTVTGITVATSSVTITFSVAPAANLNFLVGMNVLYASL